MKPGVLLCPERTRHRFPTPPPFETWLHGSADGEDAWFSRVLASIWGLAKGWVVRCRGLKRRLEADALSAGGRGRAVAAAAEPNRVVEVTMCVELVGLVDADVSDAPVGDEAAVAAGTAGRVAGLPAGECRRGFVAVGGEGDVVPVGGWRGGVRGEGGCVAAGVGAVGVDAAEVVPIVRHGDNEFEFVFLAGGVVFDADGLCDVVEELVVDVLVGWLAEGPHSRDL